MRSCLESLIIVKQELLELCFSRLNNKKEALIIVHQHELLLTNEGSILQKGPAEKFNVIDLGPIKFSKTLQYWISDNRTCKIVDTT